MTIYRRFIPPPALTGGAADAAGFTLRIVHRLRKQEKRRQESELVDWEEEGGRLAAPAIAPQSF